MAIFWGIMLAWIIPTLLSIALVVLLIVLGVIGTAALAPRSQTTPTPNADTSTVAETFDFFYSLGT